MHNLDTLRIFKFVLKCFQYQHLTCNVSYGYIIYSSRVHVRNIILLSRGPKHYYRNYIHII